MEKLVNKCRRLLALTDMTYVRSLMDEIHWDNRLIAIRGAKGVGKTTLMLQYLKLHGCDCKEMLYVSLDNSYFSLHKLEDFVEEFYQKGGKLLMLDEVHKYPTWSQELKNVYDEYPDLKIVFSGSSLLHILNGDADLSRRCVPYDMYGLSFREYLILKQGILLPKVSLEELLEHPNDFCGQVNAACRPLTFFGDYLQRGYYPFFLEGEEDYPIRVENVVNFILEVELPLLCGVEMSNVRKLKSLLAIIASNLPLQLDMTKLSAMAGMSRTTLLGYLKYLSDARLLNLLYSAEDNMKKLQKPDKIYTENPNLMEVLALQTTNIGCLRESFLVGQLKAKHRVEYARKGDILVDGTYTIEIGGKSKEGKQIAGIEHAFIASDDLEYAYGNKIPLWAFGFLY